jgi:hypothetical protein
VQKEEEEEDGDAVDGHWGESLAPGEALLDKLMACVAVFVQRFGFFVFWVN